jgi:hypothetical protein
LKPFLTIVTPSHLNLDGLKILYTHISPQLSSLITWCVQDTGVCTQTERYFQTLGHPNIVFNNDGDTGIYNAINKALKNAGQYYLVCGADDTLSSDLFDFISFLQGCDETKQHDIIAFSVNVGSKKVKPRKFYWMTISLRGYISSHSVGTMIKKTLHHELGYYSEKYIILSDCLFLSKCCINRKKRQAFPNISAGTFGVNGISSTDVPVRIQEAYDYHIELGYNPFFQYILKMLRLTKYRTIRRPEHK